MATATTKTLDELKKEFEAKIKEINSDLSKSEPLEVELRKIEADYNSLLEAQIFAGLNDVEACIRKFDFEALSHKKVAKGGIVTGFEQSTRTTILNLAKFCERKEIPLDWAYQLEAYSKREILRVYNAVLDIPDEKERKKTLAKIATEVDSSYKMSKFAKEIAVEAKTPYSNTACVKHLQAIFDMLLPDVAVANINNHDVAFIDCLVTKKDRRSRLGVKVADGSSRDFREAFMVMAYHKLTGEPYQPVYKKNS